MLTPFFKRGLVFLLLVMPLFPCRMLGVIALPGESLSSTDINGDWHPYLLGELEEFRLQGGSGQWPYNNQDGWAMTSYHVSQDVPEIQTVRSDEGAYSDVDYYYETSTLLDETQVPILIGHLRQTSSGATDIENPHPFIYTDDSGVNFSFGHNGDISKEAVRELIGDEWLTLHPPQTYDTGPWDGSGWDSVIDSELFFFWIIKNIEELNSVLEGIQQALIVLEDQQPWQLKNFLFSDGTDLYAYRRSLMSDIHYFDASQNNNLPPHLSESNHRVVMSTPPTDGAVSELPWIELPDRNLLIFRGDGSTEIHAGFIPTGLIADTPIPGQYRLSRAYPNPFNNSTTIPVQANESGYYSIHIFNLKGQMIFAETNWVNDGSVHNFLWSGLDGEGNELPSGSFFFQISSCSENVSRGKLLLLK
ncbi:MAG: T9SS type A sorting domain-containing protein [Candidatus Marinimicrobia bacterium]|nr:T9SS type A sorting domain-containing protein [Candidatus Neomarinimicrobiota bacterium]MBT4360879.1 T9SS type A sorting domain-containing protein [Candidatus Neomarinimicrobiota bacterium]MBT4715341.1 T9SS type A sorting domain-containing protein [Candidatus Neomarinimicrobiota bacterium]MBT5268368.1 T9SS type A sorting domain-containing protein [Candidatus Neomarinimicrobiota bacterium]MBT6011158.1 T9SS type A sorting domain-containing protein [Candidatus Neomarinimicrobiota bacterium]